MSIGLAAELLSSVACKTLGRIFATLRIVLTTIAIIRMIQPGCLDHAQCEDNSSYEEPDL